MATPVSALRNEDVVRSLQQFKIGAQLHKGSLGSFQPPQELHVGFSWTTAGALTQSMAEMGYVAVLCARARAVGIGY